MRTSSANMLLTCAILALSGSGCAADTSANNQGSQRTLEDDVQDVMTARSTAALNEAPGGGGYGGDCYDAYSKCMNGCEQYNTRWDAFKTIIWGSSDYTRCRDKCDLAYHVCKGGMSAGSGLF